jgi:DNA topoisomerase-1
MSDLVIVESPTKARTLSRFLGSNYKIEASMGHIRDLPKGDLGVNIEDNFEPQYVIPRDKKKRVNELKKVADKADTIYLASDPDREGEAIAWHLANLLGKGHKLERVEFHEITESAIKEAFAHPRTIDLKLVDAQQARRVLDRLVGYKLSPLLWKKVKRGLSAGRVQTVALRLICEREREIEAFKAAEYWSIDAHVEGDAKKSFLATLTEVNGKKLAIWNEVSKDDSKLFFIKTKDEAESHVNKLKEANYKITKVTQKEVKHHLHEN